MLHFDCPHCGNHLHLNDEYAGRDGWCRACKGVIVAPKGSGSPPLIDDLPLSARYTRLNQLFKFAATKADNYKLLLGRLKTQRDSLAEEVAAAGAWRDESEVLRRQVRDLESQLRRATAALEARSAESSTAKPEATTDDSAEQELAAMRRDNDELRKALKEAEDRTRAEASNHGKELHKLRDQVNAWQREAGERGEQLAEAQARYREYRRQLAVKEQEHAAATEAARLDMERIEARLEESGRTAADEVTTLEQGLAALRDERKVHADRIAALEHQAAEARHAADTAETRHEDKLAGLRTELEDVKAQLGVRNQQLAQESQRADAADIRSQTLARELEAARAAAVAAEDRMEQLSARVDELERQAEDYDSELKQAGAAREERDRLGKELEELRQLLAALEEEVEAPSFSALAEAMESVQLTPVPPGGANDDGERVIIPEIVGEASDGRDDPMVGALMRFLRERRNQP